MTQPTSAPEAQLVAVLKHSRLGFISLAIFVGMTVLEVLFVAIAVFLGLSLPGGAAETFPFAVRVAVVLVSGQVVHVLGISCGIVGACWKDQERTLAVLGIVTNALMPLLFLLS